MKTRVITSAVGLVVLFAVMALFDTFVFNVVIAAICLLAIHEVFKAFRFEKGPVSLHIIRMDDRFAPEPHQLAHLSLTCFDRLAWGEAAEHAAVSAFSPLPRNIVKEVGPDVKSFF